MRRVIVTCLVDEGAFGGAGYDGDAEEEIRSAFYRDAVARGGENVVVEVDESEDD